MKEDLMLAAQLRDMNAEGQNGEATTKTGQLYRHFDESGRLLYVGVSLNTMVRLSQHREHSHWFASIKSVTIENFQTRQEALAAERAAIANENPAYNLQLKPKERRRVEKALRSEVIRSEAALVHKIVNFKPVYQLREAAAVLGIRPIDLIRMVNDGTVGYIILSEKTKETPSGLKTIRTFGMTGWQLMEHLEAMERKTAAPEPKTSQRPRRRGVEGNGSAVVIPLGRGGRRRAEERQRALPFGAAADA